jgi:hypothetical protein
MIDLGLKISPDAINDSGVIVGQGPGGAIVDTGNIPVPEQPRPC